MVKPHKLEEAKKQAELARQIVAAAKRFALSAKQGHDHVKSASDKGLARGVDLSPG